MKAIDHTAVRLIATAPLSSMVAALQSVIGEKPAGEIAEQFAAVDDAAFSALVLREARGQLPKEVADILGHPLLCHRWFHAIKAEQVRVAPPSKGQARYWAALAESRSRAVHAIREANSQAFGIKPPGGKQTPRARAINRLIEAHLNEFNALVAEEVATPEAATA